MPAQPPVSPVYELEGPVLRVVGRTRGFVETAPDVGVRGADLDALIRRHRDFFAARGEAVEWKTRSHDLPTDLAERLGAAGFVAEERETVVIGLTGPLASAPTVPDGIILRRVTSRSDFERIAALQTEVWGEDHSWLADDLESSVGEAGDDVVIIVVEAGDRLVSSARLEFQPGTDFAGLWGGSTLSEWRGRGIYRALVAARAQARRPPRRALPPGRRLGRQPADPAAPRLRGRHNGDPLRLDSGGLTCRGIRRALNQFDGVFDRKALKSRSYVPKTQKLRRIGWGEGGYQAAGL
ncbi:GNAT family N-acetyltransferase [Cryobacterium breve]|uniref:GNAT family N-acetyltransferase n=1 Tax=Cryobacterium breve TaxID=1259258 RepID=A0ABY7NJ28_9MICO|nr:GNAT family N-acetyltransferase [Cryobacterium breve]WBM80533.1 GNAT family N-acetyltransferase [Cryobacterium breve]